MKPCQPVDEHAPAGARPDVAPGARRRAAAWRASRTAAVGALALTVVVCLGACSAPAPRSWRMVAGPASERPVAGGPFADFHLFGWAGPPPDSMSVARVDELAGAGFDLVLPAENDPGAPAANLIRLDLAAAHGLRCLIWDRRMDAFDRVDPAGPMGRAVLDSIVGDYTDHAGLFGYYLGDEPRHRSFGLLGGIHAALRRRDPGHPGWNNLFGRGAFRSRAGWLHYLRSYVERVRPAILCDDHYDFMLQGDRGFFVENAAGLSAVARASGLPFWGIVRVVECDPYRALRAGEMRWEAAMLLAYGARGLGYFTYWTPAPDPKMNWKPAMIARDGRRTARYDTVAAIDRDARPVGEALTGCVWLAAEHAGSTPLGGTPFSADGLVRAVEGRAVLAHFADSLGRGLLLVANPDSVTARTIVLRLERPRQVSRLDPARGWSTAPDSAGAVTLALPAGGFALLRVEGPAATIACGTAPNCAIVTKAAGLRFALSGVSGRGEIEVLDARGARVWSSPLAPGDSETVWDQDGVAPDAIGWVRVEDDRGVAVIPLPRGAGS